MLELVVSRTLDREREYTGTSESLHQQHFASTALLLLMLLMTADDAAAADDDDDDPAAESPPRRHPVLTPQSHFHSQRDQASWNFLCVIVEFSRRSHVLMLCTV